MSAFHLDAGFTPLFPFGHGLSYAHFDYQNIRVDSYEVELGTSVTVSAELTNRGDVAADEVAQLYVRDLVASVTRPVKELKAFKRVRLGPGETVTLEFVLHTDDLSFFGRDMKRTVEPGEFHAWVGGSSDTHLRTEFRIIQSA
jgi:beta-glucosidase